MGIWRKVGKLITVLARALECVRYSMPFPITRAGASLHKAEKRRGAGLFVLLNRSAAAFVVDRSTRRLRSTKGSDLITDWQTMLRIVHVPE